MTETAHEVALSRYFDAPPEMVFKAFTDAEQLAQWYAPLAFHIPLDSVDVDVRRGGHWRLTMVGHVAGYSIPIEATFTEVVSNRLIVGYEVASGVPGIEDGTHISLSIELIPEGEGTRLELRQGPLPGMGGEMAAIGWGQAFAKLAGLLATPPRFRNNPHTVKE